jgi:hypothetical protein
MPVKLDESATKAFARRVLREYDKAREQWLTDVQIVLRDDDLTNKWMKQHGTEEADKGSNRFPLRAVYDDGTVRYLSAHKHRALAEAHVGQEPSLRAILEKYT